MRTLDAVTNSLTEFMLVDLSSIAIVLARTNIGKQLNIHQHEPDIYNQIKAKLLCVAELLNGLNPIRD